MKKIYVKPSIQEVKIQATTILAGSDEMAVEKGAQSGVGGWGGIQSIRNDFGEIESED